MTHTISFLSAVTGRAARAAAPALLFWLLAAPAAAQTVRVADKAEVSRESLLLGDIAEVVPDSTELSAIPLGYAPYAGHYRWITREELEGILRKWGHTTPQVTLIMPDKVLVTRRSQLVPARRVEDAVREHFRGSEYRVLALDAASDAVLAEGEVEIVVDPPARFTSLRSVSIKVNLVLDGRLERSQWVRASLSLRREVLVAARELPSGHRIQPSDVRLAELDLQRDGEYFEDAASAAGSITRRRLGAGAPLSERVLRRPQAVRSGDIVTLVAQGRALRVSANGRARASGKVGETIPVENLSSRKVVRGIITGEKQVEVKLPGAQR